MLSLLWASRDVLGAWFKKFHFSFPHLIGKMRFVSNHRVICDLMKVQFLYRDKRDIFFICKKLPKILYTLS